MLKFQFQCSILAWYFGYHFKEALICYLSIKVELTILLGNAKTSYF